MELIIRDNLECCEYPKEFTDYQHRYVLEQVISREGSKVVARVLGYCDSREKFDYIVEAVNAYSKTCGNCKYNMLDGDEEPCIYCKHTQSSYWEAVK